MTNTTFWIVPPKIKVYEALSAIADGRVYFLDSSTWKQVTWDTSDTVVLPIKGEGKVSSSDRSKEYQVRWNLLEGRIRSDDNGSKWQGYLGYPAVAILMLTGKLPFSKTVALYLRGIEWKTLNIRFKRDYAAVLEYVLDLVADQNCRPPKIDEFVDEVMSELRRVKCLKY